MKFTRLEQLFVLHLKFPKYILVRKDRTGNLSCSQVIRFGKTQSITNAMIFDKIKEDSLP